MATPTQAWQPWRWPVTPALLLAAYPVLFLYSHNQGQVPPGHVLRPLAVSVAAALALWGLAVLATRSRPKAAVLCSACWLWWFGWGHLCRLTDRLLPSVAAALPEAVQAGWLLALAAAGWLLLRTKRDLAPAARALAAVSLGLVALQIALAAPAALRGRPAARQPAPVAAPVADRPAHLPNIYYVILDSYGRADLLARAYGHDNRPFTQALAQRGFYVADESAANYGLTVMSLAASLNMTYLDDLAARAGLDSQDWQPLSAAIAHNHAAATLRRYGYRTVYFPCGFTMCELQGVDEVRQSGVALTDLERMVVDLTPVATLRAVLAGRHPDEVEQQRRLIRFTLSHLAAAGRGRQPAFVFAHLMCPHPPFVFDRRGGRPPYSGLLSTNDVDDLGGNMPRQQWAEQYREQLVYLNTLVLSAVDRIIEADPGAVIILQGDHGPRRGTDWREAANTDTQELFAILNALRLPGRRPAALRPTLSPVNNLRLVLGEYLGLPLPQLPDRSHYSTWRRPYRYTTVTVPAGELPSGPACRPPRDRAGML